MERVRIVDYGIAKFPVSLPYNEESFDIRLNAHLKDGPIDYVAKARFVGMLITEADPEAAAANIQEAEKVFPSISEESNRRIDELLRKIREASGRFDS